MCSFPELTTLFTMISYPEWGGVCSKHYENTGFGAIFVQISQKCLFRLDHIGVMYDKL